MNVFVFGNADLSFDSLAIKMLPTLKARFSEIEFTVKDPNEEWGISDDLIIIDAVDGIDKITTFDSLENFSRSPSITMHDFDAYANLKLLEKLGKLKKIKIIGVPTMILEDEAIKQITPILSSI